MFTPCCRAYWWKTGPTGSTNRPTSSLISGSFSKRAGEPSAGHHGRFCDVRGFTAFAETAEPEEVTSFLREYHTRLGALIYKYEGTLERFTGDGLMVLFNDPLRCTDPSIRAVRMAVEMRTQVNEATSKWRKQGHELGFGMGISYGYATLGLKHGLLLRVERRPHAA